MVQRFASYTLSLASARRSLKEILFRPGRPAVYVPPGARLRVRDISVDVQRHLCVGAVEEVTFVQKSAEAFIHRDALRFANGCEILLQWLECGQRVDVLSLGGAREEINLHEAAISTASFL